MKILAQITGTNITYLKDGTIGYCQILEALAAMSVLQKRIDELEKYNEELFQRVQNSANEDWED